VPANPPPIEDVSAPKRFNFADVHRRAAVLAAQPFEENKKDLPAFVRDLNYDQYQDIRFRAEKGLWRDEKLPFDVQFAPLGFLFLWPIKINVVENGEVKPIAYSNDYFDYGRNKVPPDLPNDLGFAGLRLLYPLHQDGRYDEVAVFLGASYFRAVGQNQGYGISARGLAIDTGLPKTEEFPFFREFWLEKPARDATELTVYALLDSQSAAGAYRFVIKPGLATVIEVKAHVFMRNKVQKLAIAPLTSMFFHGELTDRFMDDFRPEVHDSDGLLLATGSGEWLWRPVVNPRRLQVSSFQDTNPKGFGLLQRDRDFNDYQDLESLYQKRPSVWVEPLGEWGKGVVQLIEIPSNAEKYDNIVAFWVPDLAAEGGQNFSFDYRLNFELSSETRPPGGRTLATRIGAGGVGDLDASKRRLVIDFGGGNLDKLPGDAPVEAVVNTSAGQVINTVVQKNPFTNGWRLSFELLPESADSITLRCYLKLGADVLTETWSYQWSAK
jgi:glucans biosynthesis protein